MFPDEDLEIIISALDLYGTESHEQESERYQLAVLKLANGSVDELLTLIQIAN